jgi:septal ring factor EnvC (AmiA/AmiB activator)
VFVGELPVLGSAVILDHGERFFTLYGRLANSVVVSGSVVEAGVPVGEAAGDKPLYFEVRQNGVPVDPRPFFAR